MSEQLDWLARNVHEWPYPHQDAAFVGCEINCLGLSVKESYKGLSPSNVVKVTRQQWLDRRAELQGKPSWADHPDAKCFVQNDTGTWFKNTKSCGAISGSNGGWYDEDKAGGWVQLGGGEVLGDWRDTLELRPASLGVSADEGSAGFAAVGAALRPLSRADALRWAVENVKTWPTWESGEQAAPAGWSWVQLSGAMYLGARTNVPAISEEHWARVLFKSGIEEFTSLEDAPPHTINCRCVARRLHPIHCQLLLNEPELVVFRTADGELLHCKPKECLIDPDQYDLAARLLSDMSGHAVAPEHIRELAEQMGWAA